MIQARNLSALTRYLSRAAPRLSVSGLRQSRRLETQFSREVERNCYSEILLALPIGAGHQSAALRVICKAITTFQRDHERGDYGLRLVVYGGAKPFSARQKFGYKSTANSMLRWLTKQVLEAGAKTHPQHTITLNALPAPHSAALVAIVQTSAQNRVSEAALKRLANHPRKQILWLRLDEETFYMGPNAPPDVEVENSSCEHA
jgi:hypothetical protein